MQQGEANADQKIKDKSGKGEIDMTAYYAAMYQAMIKDWRDRKGMGDFAFMTVQLPPSEPADTKRPPAPPTSADPTGRMRPDPAFAQRTLLALTEG